MVNFETLFDLERELLNPYVRSNIAQLKKLISTDFIEFGSSGVVYDYKKAIDSLVKDSAIEITASNFKGTILSSDVVLVTYISIEKEQKCLRSSIWKLSGSQWQIIFHQGTKA